MCARGWRRARRITAAAARAQRPVSGAGDLHFDGDSSSRLVADRPLRRRGRLSVPGERCAQGDLAQLAPDRRAADGQHPGLPRDLAELARAPSAIRSKPEALPVETGFSLASAGHRWRLGALAGLVIAALLGLIIAGTIGSAPASGAGGKVVYAGTARVSVPSSWRREAVPAALSSGLTRARHRFARSCQRFDRHRDDGCGRSLPGSPETACPPRSRRSSSGSTESFSSGIRADHRSAGAVPRRFTQCRPRSARSLGCARTNEPRLGLWQLRACARHD